jgi:hypothetical protein
MLCTSDPHRPTARVAGRMGVLSLLVAFDSRFLRVFRTLVLWRKGGQGYWADLAQ